MEIISRWVKNHVDFLWLLASWLLAILVVNPIGDFPLNDDWAFGKTVYYLTEEGRLHFTDWQSMTLIAQVIWGAAFTFLFGFSFTVLRISTLIVSFGGIWLMYKWIKRITGRRLPALLAAMTLAFNPLYFSLSFTFMTDVPFLCTFLLAAYFFYQALDHDIAGKSWKGMAWSILAVLIRQFGILAPLAFAPVYLIINLLVL